MCFWKKRSEWGAYLYLFESNITLNSVSKLKTFRLRLRDICFVKFSNCASKTKFFSKHILKRWLWNRVFCYSFLQEINICKVYLKPAVRVHHDVHVYFNFSNIRPRVHNIWTQIVVMLSEAEEILGYFSCFNLSYCDIVRLSCQPHKTDQ